ncbi:hypothetical protein SDJN03_01776, partial [Cucurbita argyrosperma subsp. sororia]
MHYELFRKEKEDKEEEPNKDGVLWLLANKKVKETGSWIHSSTLMSQSGTLSSSSSLRAFDTRRKADGVGAVYQHVLDKHLDKHDYDTIRLVQYNTNTHDCSPTSEGREMVGIVVRKHLAHYAAKRMDG